MKTYHNDPKLKQDMLDEMKLHQKQDQLIKGVYGKENGVFKGCAVGCAVHSFNRKRNMNIKYDDHASLAGALDFPEWVLRLADSIFEGLEEKESKKFPLEFLKAVPVGKNIDVVEFKFKKFLLLENHKRVSELKDITQKLKNQVLRAIDLVLDMLDGAIETGKIDESAESAAWSAAWSAETAARSAAWSAARSAAWSAAFLRYKNELIRLLEEEGKL